MLAPKKITELTRVEKLNAFLRSSNIIIADYVQEQTTAFETATDIIANALLYFEPDPEQALRITETAIMHYDAERNKCDE